MFSLLFAANIGYCDNVKKKSKSKLGKYSKIGSKLTKKISPGEVLSYEHTFYKNKHYRLLINSIKDVKDLNFIIIGEDNEVLYNNRLDKYASKIDFVIDKTEKLKIKFVVPKSKNKIKKTRVSILIGCMAYNSNYLF